MVKRESISLVMLLPTSLVLRGTVPGADQVGQGICTTLSCRGRKTPNSSLYHRRREPRGWRRYLHVQGGSWGSRLSLTP